MHCDAAPPGGRRGRDGGQGEERALARATHDADVPVLELSAATGEGIDAWVDWLVTRRAG